MNINVRKLIEKISKYDYVTIGHLVIAAEEVETIEQWEKERQAESKNK